MCVVVCWCFLSSSLISASALKYSILCFTVHIPPGARFSSLAFCLKYWKKKGKKGCWSIHSVFLDCNGLSSEGVRVLAEIGFISLSCWCHLLFPCRERKVQAGQRWEGSDRRVLVFVVEHAQNMLALTSVCNMSLLTCIQHLFPFWKFYPHPKSIFYLSECYYTACTETGCIINLIL